MKKIIYTAMMLGSAFNVSATNAKTYVNIVYANGSQAELARTNASFAQQIAQRRIGLSQEISAFSRQIAERAQQITKGRIVVQEGLSQEISVFSRQIAERACEFAQRRVANEDNELGKVVVQNEEARAWGWFDYINPVAWIKWMLGY